MMQPFPHRYVVSTGAEPAGETRVGGGPLPSLRYALPAEFGGSRTDWSPETLAVAAVAACFVLTFRAIARSARLGWTALSCEVSGSVDQVDDAHQFVAFHASAVLDIADGCDVEKATHLLALAKTRCLIANSFKAPCLLETTVRPPAAGAPILSPAASEIAGFATAVAAGGPAAVPQMEE